MSTEQPVIIIGAGVSGLTLAQACQKKRIPFRIFERNNSATHSQHRTVGKGLLEGAGLGGIKTALSDDLALRLSECHVDRGAVGFGDGQYGVFDLSTAEAYRQQPVSKRVRLSREKLRTLLLTGIKVQWSKTLTEISTVDNSVKAVFSDGTSDTGSIIVGCDGTDSTVNRILHPQGHQDPTDPEIRLLLATASYPATELSAMRKIDSFFLHCVDPKTDVYLWINFLENPSEDNHAADTEQCQLLLIWPYRPNWLDRADPTDCPNTQIGQRALLKHLSESWAEPFRSLIQNMPRDANIHPVDLANGLIAHSTTSFGGRVTLAGSAANPLSTPLGDSAEFSSADIANLLDSLLEPMREGASSSGEFDFEAARERYESAVKERAAFAIYPLLEKL
jgi:2-polyprenyl-6-methoxyphenol hydroxylase-like FAD-dependent oxidoreductase